MPYWFVTGILLVTTVTTGTGVAELRKWGPFGSCEMLKYWPQKMGSFSLQVGGRGTPVPAPELCRAYLLLTLLSLYSSWVEIEYISRKFESSNVSLLFGQNQHRALLMQSLCQYLLFTLVILPKDIYVSISTSMAFISILVSLNGILSGNFSLVIATSKQSPKSMWTIFPLILSNIKLDGCLKKHTGI